MTSRTLRIAAAALATVALAACNKATETPKADSTAAANATQTTMPVDSSLKIDSTAPKPTIDSAKPAPAPDKK